MNADKVERIRKVAPIGHTIRFRCRKVGLPNVMQADVTGMAADLGVTVDVPEIRFVKVEDIYESFKVTE